MPTLNEVPLLPRRLPRSVSAVWSRSQRVTACRCSCFCASGCRTSRCKRWSWFFDQLATAISYSIGFMSGGSFQVRGLSLDVPEYADERHFMAQLVDLKAPEMCANACLHGDDTRWHLTEEPQQLRSPQFVAQDRSTCAVSSMNPKHVLRQIKLYCDNLRYDRPPLWFIADPRWHIDAAVARSHHRRPAAAFARMSAPAGTTPCSA